MTTWTPPKTWATGELVTAADMNTYIRDNLLYLKDANKLTYVEVDNSYSTTSASWNNIDTSNLALNVTTSGGLLIMGMRAAVRTQNSANNYGDRTQILFDITRDGNRIGGSYGAYAWTPISRAQMETANIPLVGSFQYPLPALAAGTYTFRLQWRKRVTYQPSSETAYIENTAAGGVPVLFYALEIAI